MLTRKIQLKKISSVTASRTALIECPVGPRYHGIVLVGSHTTAAVTALAPSILWNEIRCNYNGAIQRRIKADRLDLIQTAMGAEFASRLVNGGAANGWRTYLPIFFGEPWRARYTDRDALAWQTRHLDEANALKIEVDLTAVATPVLTAYAIVDDFGAGKPHAIMKYFTSDHQTAAATVTLYPERRDLISQISAFNTSDSKIVQSAKLTAAGVEIYNQSAHENMSFLKNFARMNPAVPTAAADAAGGAYHLVFDHDDALDDVLPTAVNSMELELAFAATAPPDAALAASAGTISLITQRLGLPE